MSDPAREVKIFPISTEGLDEVFEAQDNPTQPSSALDHSEALDSPAQDWTVMEAAKQLGISEKTVLRRLQRGTLPGYKIAGQFGPEWRINNEGQPKTAQDNRLDSPAQDRRTPQPSPTLVDVEPCPPPDSVVDPKLMTIIENQAHQLKAAGDVIMYLRSQVEEKDTQLKLLTDSQHKRGSWSRFWSWFLGR